jgi:hypothetical protein
MTEMERRTPINGAELVYSSGLPKKQKQLQPASMPPIKRENAITLPKMIKGSVHAQWVKCGKPGCKCARGELHGPYFYLFWRERGRLRKAYIRTGDLPHVLAAIHNYRLEKQQVRDAKSMLRQIRELLRNGEAMISKGRECL